MPSYFVGPTKLHVKPLITVISFTVAYSEVIGRTVHFEPCDDVIADIIVADRKICRILEEPLFEDRLVIMKTVQDICDCVKYMRLMIEENYNEICDKASDWFNFGIPKLNSLKYDVNRLQRTFKWSDTDEFNFVSLMSKFHGLISEYYRKYCSIKFSPDEVARVNATLFPVIDQNSKLVFLERNIGL